MVKYIISVAFICLVNLSGYCQSIERSYSGWWAMTQWSFHFKKDNTYKRTTSGHYGATEHEGKYKLSGDTVVLVTGSEKIDGMPGSRFLFYKDSFLVDMQLFYDYKLVGEGINSYNSKKRYEVIPQPNWDSLIVITRPRLDAIAQICTDLLSTHKLTDIKDEDHVKIIRLINTISMDRDQFTTKLYTDFIKKVEETKYEGQMPNYYDWTVNRGMGYYFLKLQIELHGTPHLYSRFTLQ